MGACLATSAGQQDLERRDSIQKIAKALHFVGLAMFLGSILGHVTIGFVPGARDQAQAMLFGRQAIEIATWSLTVPGLALLAVTGLFMTLRGGLGFGRQRWLTDHWRPDPPQRRIDLGAGRGRPSRVASKIIQGSASIEAFAALAGRERMFGAVNLVLALATIFVAVLKPALGRSRN